MSAIEELKGWLSESTIECNCVAQKVEHGNGLVFGAERQDTLVSVPSDMVIHAPNIMRWDQPSLLHRFLHRTDMGKETKDVELTERKILARWLLYQLLLVRRGTPDLRFASWIRSLPPSRDIGLPISWDDDEIQSLHGTSIYEAVASKKSHLKKTFSMFFEDQSLREEISAFIKAGSREEIQAVELEVTLNDWVLVDEWISSRALSLPDQQDDMMTVMVPVVDLANHAANPTACYVANDQGGVDLVRLYGNPGDQVTINYGPESGAGEFLFKYGFIPNGMDTARHMTVFNNVMDPKFRKCVDEDHDPEYKVDEDSEEIDAESSYEILFALLYQSGMPHQTVFTDIGGVPTWHDMFITLHCCGSDLEVVHDPDREYLALHFRDSAIDISQLEQCLKDRDAEFYQSVIRPRGNKAIVNILETMYLDDKRQGGHRLVALEQKLMQSVISQARQHTRDD